LVVQFLFRVLRRLVIWGSWFLWRQMCWLTDNFFSQFVKRQQCTSATMCYLRRQLKTLFLSQRGSRLQNAFFDRQWRERPAAY
jgi:hypothetical protein